MSNQDKKTTASTTPPYRGPFSLSYYSYKAFIRKPNVEFYKDSKFQWRWKMQSINGKITGASSEGYANKSMCKQNLATVARDILDFIAKEPD